MNPLSILVVLLLLGIVSFPYPALRARRKNARSRVHRQEAARRRGLSLANDEMSGTLSGYEICVRCLCWRLIPWGR